MNVKVLTRGSVALAASLAVATWATPVAAAPVLFCPVGYVCLVPNVGATQLVPEGTGRTFLPPLAVRDVTNHTRLNYCVSGRFSYVLRPGAEVTRPDTVRAVGPGSVCLA